MTRPYPMLALNLLLSLAIMYLVMFAMINGWSDFYKTGDEAVEYIEAETERVEALYEELGL